MPITSSAKKALRASARKKVFNDRRRRAVYEAVKEFRKLIHEKNANTATQFLPRVYKALDKAAKTGVLKKNAASRQKSRLVKSLQKLSQ